MIGTAWSAASPSNSGAIAAAAASRCRRAAFIAGKLPKNVPTPVQIDRHGSPLIAPRFGESGQAKPAFKHTKS
jgi:hypothetical protein